MPKFLKLAALSFLSLAIVGASCNPTPPNPTPTPTPTPTPPPSAVRTDMLLRQADARVHKLDGSPVLLFQAVACCGYDNNGTWDNTLPGVSNIRWPLISSEAMSYFAQYGANFFHMRLGPFYGDPDHENLWSDVGGPYLPDGSFNEAFFSKVEEFVSFAAQKGWWVELNVIDTWYCKHAQWGDQEMPWPDAAVQACGRTPGDPTQEAWIRYVVQRFNKYGNVLWQIDNEGDQISGRQRAWFEWVYSQIREAEQLDSSHHVHLIGTNSGFDDLADYNITHARAALTAPIGGRWSTNNERNPSFSPEQEAANFKTARDLGLVYSYWRAEQKPEEVDRTLNLFKSVVEGGAPTGCFPPASDDPLWLEPPSPGGATAHTAAVAAAQDVVGDYPTSSHDESIAKLDKLAQQLRVVGLCAGRLDDAVFIWEHGTVWTEWHAVRFTDGRWSQDPGQRPKNTWTYQGPPPVACSPIPPDFDHWIVVVHNTGPNWIVLDSTPKIHNLEYCSQFGFGADCPVRPEGDPQRKACEELSVGAVVWSGPGEPVPDGNPYQRRVRRQVGGVATVCGKNNVCGSVEVPL